ncbi:HK97 gp10 family phage protein [Streptomyces sp. NPDC051133]|uniref:HK97 gp10 family phage protein n=1 Tax=Streptomyces sp. NPDC051133 TaxID=3155521 RepID=UPI00342B547E
MAAADTSMRHSAKALVAQVQRNASGRPGPRVITGRYRSSWQSDVHRAGPVIVAEVGTNAPQGRRLEFGFVGVDSIGRHYNQPPFPHLGPAVGTFGPLLMRELGTAISRAL